MCLSIYLDLYVSVCMSIYISVCMCVCAGGRVLVQAPDPAGPAQGGDGAAELHRREVT